MLDRYFACVRTKHCLFHLHEMCFRKASLLTQKTTSRYAIVSKRDSNCFQHQESIAGCYYRLIE